MATKCMRRACSRAMMGTPGCECGPSTLVLAFLTGRPLPRVPPGARPGWRALSPRSRECVLAAVLDAVVTARAAALQQYYLPGT